MTSATIHTEKGDIQVDLYSDSAPKALHVYVSRLRRALLPASR